MAGFFLSSLLFLISLGMVCAPRPTGCLVDLRAAGATRDGSAVCSRHIDRQHKYTVLCASLFFDIIMTFVSNVIELFCAGRVPEPCG